MITSDNIILLTQEFLFAVFIHGSPGMKSLAGGNEVVDQLFAVQRGSYKPHMSIRIHNRLPRTVLLLSAGGMCFISMSKGTAANETTGMIKRVPMRKI